MAAAKTRATEAEGDTVAEDEVLENDADRWLGWTVQQGQNEDDDRPDYPPMNLREMPQVYHPDQLPTGENAPEMPEHLITDDWSLIDPPGGVALNREIVHEELEKPYAGMDAPTPAATEPDLEAMTKAQLQAFASEHQIQDVNSNTQTKEEMIEAIDAALAEQQQA